MELSECRQRGIVRSSKVDRNLALSLVEMSGMKEQTVLRSKIDSISIQGFFTIAYDSLREVMEAFCALKGYKVYNHECLGRLMAAIMPEFNIILFERVRYARNSINYYGKKVDLGQGKALIEKMFGMREKIVKCSFNA